MGIKYLMHKRKDPKTKTSHIGGSILLIPITILERYKEATLLGRIMFINGIRFINTILRYLKFMTVEHIANAESATQQESIRKIK